MSRYVLEKLYGFIMQGYHTWFRMTGQAGEGSFYGIMEYLKRKNVYTDYSGKVNIPTVRKHLL